MNKFTSIDQYIAEFPASTQAILEQVRATIHAASPEAVEAISYAMPTFKLGGKNLIHFAGYDHHIGIYPTPSGIQAFEAELAPYKSGKGSAQFPLDQPIPYDLIRRMTLTRVAQMGKQ